MIDNVIARELIDSRGNPTLEVEVFLKSGERGRAIVPSGASTGVHEALELRDGDKTRFLGKGVLKAVAHVEGPIKKAIVGKSIEKHKELDQMMIELDGTENKSKLGANAILGVSLACAWAAAARERRPLYQWIQDHCGFKANPCLPVPLMNVINGGAHADNGLDFQEFMLVPRVGQSFARSLQAGIEVFHHLKKLLTEKNLSTAVGDEGGFAPNVESNSEALELLAQAISKAGYKLGQDLYLALDVAASEFYKNGTYLLECEKDPKYSAERLECLYRDLCKKYPIVSIEDGMAEDDWDGWTSLTKNLGDKVQLVGDDLFVTNTKRMTLGREKKAGNAILIKVNQIGTLTETFQAMERAREYGWGVVVSHRSGETEDVTISHLAVGTGCGQIKTGSASRTDRVAKYNELLRIEGDALRLGRGIPLSLGPVKK